MNILIYEDNIMDAEHLIHLINDLLDKEQIKYNIDTCPSSEFLFKNINKYDFLFLDIELHDENGIEMGKKLKTSAHNCRIIITSNFKKYLIDGYKINADRYFLKPITVDEFNVEMENELTQYNNRYKGFIDERISKNKIFFIDILYVETFDRKTKMHLVNGKTIETKLLLKEWEELLDDDMFEKPHKSYIVNLNYISSISEKELYLTSNQPIPLSRNEKKQFKERYIDAIMRMR